MAQLEYNQNLVRDQRETARYDSTHKGQASWGIGPHACGDCSFFVNKKKGGGLCGKYRQLMRGVDGPRLSVDRSVLSVLRACAVMNRLEARADRPALAPYERRLVYQVAAFISCQRAMGRPVDRAPIELDKAWPSLPSRVALGGLFLDQLQARRGTRQ